MFSKLIERLQRNTALHLTLRFALLFMLCITVLFITVDTLLARAQLDKDQQLIDSFVESYQRLEQQAGLHKLELVIARDAAYFQRSDLYVELIGTDQQRLIRVQPEAWGELALSAPPLSAGSPDADDAGNSPVHWQQAALSGSAIELLFRRVALSDGSLLTIGQSIAPRMAELDRYRTLMLQVMIPLFLLALLLSAYMNWRALRPVYDLVATVRNLQANDLKARVLVRNPRSELGELAERFNQMLSQIERLITGMQQSLDAVGHDLRTPLARMRLSLESALTRPDDAELREALLDCAEESERIERMLRTLMDLSEAQSGLLKLQPQPLQLLELAEQSVELYRYLAEDKGIRIELASCSDSRLEADPVRLQQVLGNLLDNAIKYSDPDGRIRIRWHNTTERVVLEVADEGIGITSADQSQVFERLYRADKSRAEPGMGLGLSLVKAIVAAHGGQIRLRSQIGQGCQIQIDLPRTLSHCANPPLKQPH